MPVVVLHGMVVVRFVVVEVVFVVLVVVVFVVVVTVVVVALVVVLAGTFEAMLPSCQEQPHSRENMHNNVSNRHMRRISLADI